MKSRFYYNGYNEQVADAVKNYINSKNIVFPSHTIHSPRAVGDALESLIADQFDAFLGNWCKNYSSEFGRRAMADLAFTDVEGVYSVIDVKTHREDTRFNMPNLTSVERLARFYESDSCVFSLILITYSIRDSELNVSEVTFVPIEFIDWQCLTVGALGWGQVQIANSNNIQVIQRNSRKEWMLQLCDALDEFYPREIAKITDRIQRFESVRRHWENKRDIWA